MKIRVFAFSLAVLILSCTLFPMIAHAQSFSYSAVGHWLNKRNNKEWDTTSVCSISTPVPCAIFACDTNYNNCYYLFVPIDQDFHFDSSANLYSDGSIFITNTQSNEDALNTSCFDGYGKGQHYIFFEVKYSFDDQYEQFTLMSFSGPSCHIMRLYDVNGYGGNSIEERMFNYALDILSDGDYVPGGEIDPDDGLIVPVPDEDDWIKDTDIPLPELSFDPNGLTPRYLKFTCDNATHDYYLQYKGVLYCPNDVSLKKTGLIDWSCYYDSYLFDTDYSTGKKNIVDYIDADSLTKATGVHNLTAQWAPVYSAFTSSAWSHVRDITPDSEKMKFAYSQAFSSLEDMYSNENGLYGFDFYVRYFVMDYDNNTVRAGQWRHYTVNPASSPFPIGQIPNDDPEPYPDGDDDPIDDPDDVIDDPWYDPDDGIDDDDGDGGIPNIPDIGGIFSNIINWLNSIIKGFNGINGTVSSFFNTSVDSLGQYPTILARTFQFLPQYLINAISISILIAIILRIFGR